MPQLEEQENNVNCPWPIVSWFCEIFDLGYLSVGSLAQQTIATIVPLGRAPKISFQSLAQLSCPLIEQRYKITAAKTDPLSFQLADIMTWQ